MPEYGSDKLLRQLYGIVLLEAGRYEEAATLIPADSASFLTIKARFLIKDGRIEEAESLLLSAIMADPGHGAAYMLRGELAHLRGNEEFAAALLLKGFQLSPTMAEHARAVEWIIDSSQLSQLKTVVQESVQLHPDSRMLARFQVELAFRSGDNSSVLATAERFIELFGPDEHVLDLGVAARRVQGAWHSWAPAGRSVSLCMIVKDEERHIVRCLASCRPLVHEMVVVDTGSSDRTTALAELMGARVIHHRWREDFSDARNVSIAAATGDWILVMDADEALSRQDYQAFNAVLDEAAHAHPCAFAVMTRNYTNLTSLDGFTPLDGSYMEDAAGAGWTPSEKVRLFPNHNGVYFEGVVHEMVEGTASRAKLPLRKHQVPVHHYGGLEKERLERKRTLYYALGQRKLQAGAQGPKALYELAVQAGELERFGEAEKYWLALLEQEPEAPVAWFNLGYLYLKMGRPREALNATERALTLKPGYQAALVNLAMCRFCLLPPADSLGIVEAIAARVPDDLSIQVLSYVTLCLNNCLAEGVSGIRSLATRGYDMAGFLKSTAALLRSVERIEEGQIVEALAGIFA